MILSRDTLFHLHEAGLALLCPTPECFPVYMESVRPPSLPSTRAQLPLPTPTPISACCWRHIQLARAALRGCRHKQWVTEARPSLQGRPRNHGKDSVKEAKGENVLKEVERPRYIQTTEKCKKLGKRTQCDLSTNHDNFTENSYTRVAGWKKTAIRAQQCASSVIRLNTARVTQCWGWLTVRRMLPLQPRVLLARLTSAVIGR